MIDKKKSSRDSEQETYKIWVNDKEFNFPKSTITGAEIKQLAEVDNQDFDVWQDAPNQESILIDDKKEVSLAQSTRARFQFHTRPKKSYEIKINQKTFIWKTPFITGVEIKQLAGVDVKKQDVYLRTPGAKDVHIKDEQKFDLSNIGSEEFFTTPKVYSEG